MATPKTRKAPRKAYPLRMPPALHAKLAEFAAKEQRTLNAQINHVLERWLQQQSSR
jgi:hypothetical protein